MSRSSEEVLLIVNHVKHKKSDGTLYMMGQRMAWMQPSKNSFSISHSYADIKCKYIVYVWSVTVLETEFLNSLTSVRVFTRIVSDNPGCSLLAIYSLRWTYNVATTDRKPCYSQPE